jgi:hypothetical protein
VSQALVQWLVELGKNPALASRFEQDPETEMAAFGLPEQDKKLIRDRSLVQLRTALANATKEKPRPIVLGVGF